MATTRIESDIFKINSNISSVYNFLSDLNKVGSVFNMASGMSIGNEDVEKAMKHVSNTNFTYDHFSCTLDKVGDVGIFIVDRQEPKLIKFEGDGALPFSFYVWIQLLEKGAYDTRLKITFEGDMNMMMKMMLKGKLKKGINQLGEGLTKIPYSMI